MVKRMLAFFKNKTGPLPNWAWAAILLLGFAYWRMRQVAAEAGAPPEGAGTATEPLDLYGATGTPEGAFAGTPGEGGTGDAFVDVGGSLDIGEMPEWPEFPEWPELPEVPVAPGRNGPKNPCKRVNCPKGFHKVNTGNRCKCVKNKPAGKGKKPPTKGKPGGKNRPPAKGKKKKAAPVRQPAARRNPNQRYSGNRRYARR